MTINVLLAKEGELMGDKIKIPKFSSLFFFVLCILSLIVYHLRQDPYVRPKVFFYLLALMVGVIFYQVVAITDNDKLEKALVFVEIILVSILFTSTQQGLYKTVLGRDPWTHGALISQILRNQHIPPYENIKTPYVWMPNFHLLVGSSMLLSGITYKWTLYFSIGILTLILISLLVYKIGKSIFGSTKLALASTLLMAISDNVLDKIGKRIFPNSIGVAISLLIFYLIVETKINDTRLKGLTMLTILSFSLTHSVSYVFLVIQITLIFVIALTYFRQKDPHNVKTIGYLIMAMWAIGIFVWGMVSGYYLRVFTLLVERLVTGVSVEEYASSLEVPFKFVLLGRLGMIIYLGLAGIGVLYKLYGKIRNRSASMADSALLSNSMFYVGLGALAFLLWPRIAHRFWYYSEILGSFFVACLLLRFYNSGRHKQIRKILTLGGVVVLSWLMFVASISNDDNPLVPQYSIRTGWYDSEIQAGMFVLYNNGDIPIASDWDYIAALNNLKWMFTDKLPSDPPRLGDIGWIIPTEFPKSFTEIMEDNGYLFILRKSIVQERSFYLGPKWGATRYMPLENRLSQLIMTGALKKNILYASQNVIIWG